MDSDSDADDKLRRGDKVEAKVSGWTKYYGGEITRANSDGTYDIKFEDGERKSGVKKSQMKSKSIGRGGRDRTDSEDETLSEGTAVKARFMGGKKWFPGTISKVRSNGTFDIEYNDGSDESKVPRDMIQLHVVSPKRRKDRDRYDID